MDIEAATPDVVAIELGKFGEKRREGLGGLIHIGFGGYGLRLLVREGDGSSPFLHLGGHFLEYGLEGVLAELIEFAVEQTAIADLLGQLVGHGLGVFLGSGKGFFRIGFASGSVGVYDSLLDKRADCLFELRTDAGEHGIVILA